MPNYENHDTQLLFMFAHQDLGDLSSLFFFKMYYNKKSYLNVVS